MKEAVANKLQQSVPWTGDSGEDVWSSNKKEVKVILHRDLTLYFSLTLTELNSGVKGVLDIEKRQNTPYS